MTDDKIQNKPFFAVTDEAIAKGFEIQRDIIITMQKNFDKQIKALKKENRQLKRKIKELS